MKDETSVMTDSHSPLSPVRLLKNVKRSASRAALTGGERLRRLSTARRLAEFDRIHLGSGPNQMDGWANIDIAGARNMIWDLRKPLPLKSRSIRFVYSEHFIEHISREDGRRLLTNVKAAMAPGGVLRLSTPDLRQMASDYLAGKLVVNPEGGWFPSTLCEMMNDGMRLWGHVYVYDEEDLTQLLEEVGFQTIKRVTWGESEYPELRELETRPFYQDLIVEAS
jgi:predicted SAM-dependent methyltransferase